MSFGPFKKFVHSLHSRLGDGTFKRNLSSFRETLAEAGKIGGLMAAIGGAVAIPFGGLCAVLVHESTTIKEQIKDAQERTDRSMAVAEERAQRSMAVAEERTDRSMAVAEERAQRRMAEAEERTERRMVEMRAGLKELSAEVKTVEAGLKELSAEVKTVEAGLKELSAEVKTVEAGLKELSAEVKTVAEEVHGLRSNRLE